jgi:2-keto-4-pentenoate hydratase/2-oxohepta-3-ene-1,7-dioic acid hydratase in catechol pathway
LVIIIARSFTTRLARIFQSNQENFIAIDHNGSAITSDEIATQTGLIIPKQLEKFLFNDYLKKLMKLLDNLSYIHPINEFKILPPINDTYKIICLAFNYTDHGRKCKYVSTTEASDYIAGYFVLNDVSARDIQFIDKQYTRAKGVDTFGPCGPWITTTDEIIDPCNLRITTRVNGDIRQNSSTANLVLNVNEIISKLSKVMTLEPGDIISTGTPSGTALSLSSDSKYLRHNDLVEVEIEKIGKIRNKVRFID